MRKVIGFHNPDEVNGYSMNDLNRFAMEAWRGQNLLGFSLMLVREELSTH